MPVQADLTIGGRPRKVVMVANRNGFFYTLDRETGKLLVGKPFIDNSNWAKEIGADGRPIVLDNIGTPDNCLPDNHGGTNFQPPSFDPERRLFFVTAHETCATWEPRKPTPPIRLGVRVPSGGRTPGRGPRAVRRLARHRSGDRGAALGASLPGVPVDRVARSDRRHHVDGVGLWSSPATTTATSTPSIRRPGRRCGAFRRERRYGARRRLVTCWMGASGSSRLPA